MKRLRQQLEEAQQELGAKVGDTKQFKMMQNMMKGFAPSGAAGFGPMGGMAVPCDTCDKITNQAMKEKCKKQCVSK